MSEPRKGWMYLSCLPTVNLFLGCFSLRLGSLIIGIYTVAHAAVAGFNEDLMKRRELELNLNALFSLGLIFISVLLILAVCLEQQGVVLLWLWFLLLMWLPMIIILGVVTSIHFHMQLTQIAYRNVGSCVSHLPLLYGVVVVHSYRLEIEALEDITFDD